MNSEADLSLIHAMSTEEIQKVLHDLSVHQAELEMQNDQLRKTQQELQLSQRHLYQLYYNAPVGYITLNSEGIIQQCNQKFIELVVEQETSVTGRAFIEFIAMSDRAAFKVWQRSALSLNKEETFEFNASNNQTRFLSVATTQLQVPGDELMILLTCTDVSELKASEESLKISSIVFETANEAAMVIDRNYLIISVNPAFTKITGYSPEEVVGKNPKILNSGKHDTHFYRALYSGLHVHGEWEGEIWNRRKNGEIYPEWLSINVIKDLHGDPYRYVCVFRDETRHKTAQAIIQRQATHDSLTGLPNRTLFNDRLEQAMHHAHRAQHKIALLFIDLDGFKDVNDTQGHHTGDQLLKEVATRLHSCVRETDTVARLGGDEFAIILIDVNSQESIERLLRKILEVVKLPFAFSNEHAYITASVGVTLYPGDATDKDNLLKNADQAMYSAKYLGKNCFKFFTNEMQIAAVEKHQISNDLHSCTVNDFYLYYQPIVEINSGKIIKAEALLRWNHPQKKNISPDIFIPIAEENGFIFELGEYVFQQAIKDLARWKSLYPTADFQLSINKSPKQFRLSKHHAERWLKQLKDLNLSGNSIVIEITEGLLLEHTPQVDKELLTLRDAGLEVALDDFGTGYSSLAYLKKFSIDYIKIDKLFISTLAENSDSLILCEAIILMAHKLGMKVIAEGVETRGQRSLLAQAGCDYAQGYLFAKPMPKDEFEKLLKANALLPT